MRRRILKSTWILQKAVFLVVVAFVNLASSEPTTTTRPLDSSSGTVTHPQNATLNASSILDVNSGWAKASDLLATRNISTHQMLDSCVDLTNSGLLVLAIQTDDISAFVSGAHVCTPEESGQFLKVSKIGFEQCAGFDFLEFAEGNARALGKSFFGCLETFTNNPHDTDIAIEKCTELVLDTGLGRAIGHFLEYNSIICPCLPQLQTNLPGCVFQRGDDDETFLDGPAVKLSICLLGEICNKLEGLCQEEVEDLNQCLPQSSNEINNDDSSNLSCENIEEDCKQQGALLFTLPTPLAGANFPTRCQQAATHGKDLRDAHVIERYNAYRRQCVAKDMDPVREFGSPDDADQTETSDSSEFMSPARTLSVALAIVCTVVTLHASWKRKPQYRYSEMQMSNLGDSTPQEPYRDEATEVEDVHY